MALTPLRIDPNSARILRLSAQLKFVPEVAGDVLSVEDCVTRWVTPSLRCNVPYILALEASIRCLVVQRLCGLGVCGAKTSNLCGEQSICPLCRWIEATLS